MKTGVELIAEERDEQINKHGRTPESDRFYADFELSRAACAICYSSPKGMPATIAAPDWAWEIRERKNELQRLIVAGALIAAEIDRLQNS